MPHIQTAIKNKDLVTKRRLQIVKAAIRLFSKKGFYKTTINELAQETGLSYGNIYNYIKSKDDIFALMHKLLEERVGELQREATQNVSDPMERLRRLVKAEFMLYDLYSDEVMLMYQEAHTARKEYLSDILKAERRHMQLFEDAINSCVEQGILRSCNLRLTANLIKSMIDGWVLKRWDLRHHVSIKEAENQVLEMIESGLVADKKNEIGTAGGLLNNKRALVINAHTIVGNAICMELLANGVKLVAFVDSDYALADGIVSRENQHDNLSIYSKEKHGQMTSRLLDEILKDIGVCDYYIHELGVGYRGGDQTSAEKLATNLESAIELAPIIMDSMGDKFAGRIVFISPWAWDRFVNLYSYQATCAGAVALTRALAKTARGKNLTVNCITPGFIAAPRPTALEKSNKGGFEKDGAPFITGKLHHITSNVNYLLQDSAGYLSGQEFKHFGSME